MSSRPYNPLELGTPYGSTSSLPSTGNTAYPIAESTAHLPRIVEPTAGGIGSNDHLSRDTAPFELLDGEERGSQSSSATLRNGGQSTTDADDRDVGEMRIREALDEKSGSMGEKQAAFDPAVEESQDLGLPEPPSHLKDHEHTDTPTPLPPSPTTTSHPGRVRRSSTVNSRYNRKVQTSDGGEMQAGYGMVPITKQPSLPPGFGPFGGSAPTGEDAELGLQAVRSLEEVLIRESERERKGFDEFAVRFEPGEAINPKVSILHLARQSPKLIV